MPKKILKIKKRKSPKNVEKLRELFRIVSQAKYMWEATFDAIQDPVLIIGQDYTIKRANLAAAKRCDYPIRNLIGQKCYRIFAQREAICPLCPLKETLRSKETCSAAIDGLRPDGDFQVNSYPLKLENSRSSKQEQEVVHHYRDVTEEKRLQKKLVQSEKMAAIGMLAGGVAHEINNPLAGILAFTQILKKDLPAEGQIQGDLNEIEESAKRCKKIVEDLLLFARPHREGDLTTLFLEKEIEKILPLARLNLRHGRATLTTQYESHLPPIRGSAPRLQQVFLNLIQNAAHSMAGGGPVVLKVRTNKKRSQVIAEVVDRGCGIKKTEISKIFDPFYSTKERGQGTGLGLSICYSIIEEHHGKIEVESELGHGSLFRVVFPATKNAPM